MTKPHFVALHRDARFGFTNTPREYDFDDELIGRIHPTPGPQHGATVSDHAVQGTMKRMGREIEHDLG